MGMKHSVASSAPGLIGAAEWDADHVIEESLGLPIQTATPAGVADILKLFASRRAERSMLRMIGQNALDVTLQPALFGNQVMIMMPSAAGAQSLINMSTSLLNTGTGSSQTTGSTAMTNNLTATRRMLFNTGTTATGHSGIRTAAAEIFRGNAVGRGGWFYVARFGVETFAADIRVLIGLSNNSTAITADPSAQGNQIGLIKDSADTNWHFMSRGSTLNKFNTGVAVTQGEILDFFCFAPPFGSFVAFMLMNPITGAILAEHVVNVSADMPGATTGMWPKICIQSVTGTTAKSLAIAKLYIETDL